MPKKPIKILFKIYVVGKNPKTYTTITSFRAACSGLLATSQYDIMVIDLLKNVHLAEKKKILGTPLIIKEFPAPEKRVIGEIKDIEKAKSALEFLLDEY